MGSCEAVRRVHAFIMEKIREKPDPNPKPEDTNKNFERHRQVGGNEPHSSYLSSPETVRISIH